jgi:hypothetical protein
MFSDPHTFFNFRNNDHEGQGEFRGPQLLMRSSCLFSDYPTSRDPLFCGKRV